MTQHIVPVSEAMRTALPPTISVVIPVYNAERHLTLCLDSLALSELPPFECLVVDDGSTDQSLEIARQYNVRILSTGGRRGPAYARNLAAAEAKGDVLFFIDSDVCVHPDSLSRIAERLQNNPHLQAMIGSYDESPGVPTLLSQYRNLLHCFVHQNSSAQASTFWSGCGAVRTPVFREMGGFDASYKRPSIEDIELGTRLSEAGYRIELDKDLRVKHLKHWSFLSLMKTDIFDRGVPWTELILRTGKMPNDLNLRLSHRLSVALVALLLLVATAGVIGSQGALLIPLLAILFLSLGRYWVERVPTGHNRGVIAAMMVILLIIGLLSYRHQLPALVPLLITAYSLLYLRQRYSWSTEERRKYSGAFYAIYLGGVFAFILMWQRNAVLLWTCVPLVLAIVGLNFRFYLFLANRLGFLSSLAVIPFHFLHYTYGGLSFLLGLMRYSLGWSSERTSAPHAPERARSGD